MYIFSAQFCLYYKCFIFLQTKFYVIANYSKVANIMNYFKFIKHNKNVVFRKILINIKIPDSNMSGIFIFILCCSRSKEFRRQGFIIFCETVEFVRNHSFYQVFLAQPF